MSKKRSLLTPEQLERVRMLDRERARERYHSDPQYREKVKSRNYAFRKTERGKEIESKGHKRYYATEKGKRCLARKFEKRIQTQKYKELASVAVFKAGLAYERSSRIEAHHWSYKQEHLLDVIYVELADHRRLHRMMIEDKDSLQYSRLDNGQLMRTKEDHLAFIADAGIKVHPPPK